MTSALQPRPGIGPDLRAALVAMVRKRVPESEVEDIVQAALTEAIESPHAPTESEPLRRWIFGVAKNKVVDYHRRAGRLSYELPDVPDEAAPHGHADLMRWAERNLPQGPENQKTLEWMMREGEGEKLESIAESEHLPPPRVRQRVSRLRRHFKENWKREVALLAALGVIITGLVVYLLKTKNQPEIITHDDVVDPRAEPMRKAALDKCAAQDWQRCLDGLDDAKKLDPAGDSKPEVQNARQAAGEALKTQTNAPPLPTATDSITLPPPVPSSSATPTAPQKRNQKMVKPQSTETVSSPPPPSKPSPSPRSSRLSDDSLGSDFGNSSIPATKGGGSKKKAAPPEIKGASSK